MGDDWGTQDRDRDTARALNCGTWTRHCRSAGTSVVLGDVDEAFGRAVLITASGSFCASKPFVRGRGMLHT